MLELFPDGFEEVASAGWLELAGYAALSFAGVVRKAFSDVSAVPVTPGWEDRWREFHRPVRVGGLWIGPPWAEAPPGERSVVVDPGRAFGTGAHPTTRLCIDLLSRLERGSLLDAGCGSGVVAVAAVRLGFAPVHALDVDPVAVGVARETARTNGVEVVVTHADALRDELPPATVVVANIERGVVEVLLARRLRSLLAVTSGYTAGEEPRAPGWEVVEEAELDGWGAHVLAARRALS